METINNDLKSAGIAHERDFQSRTMTLVCTRPPASHSRWRLHVAPEPQPWGRLLSGGQRRRGGHTGSAWASVLICVFPARTRSLSLPSALAVRPKKHPSGKPSDILSAAKLLNCNVRCVLPKRTVEIITSLDTKSNALIPSTDKTVLSGIDVGGCLNGMSDTLCSRASGQSILEQCGGPLHRLGNLSRYCSGLRILKVSTRQWERDSVLLQRNNSRSPEAMAVDVSLEVERLQRAIAALGEGTPLYAPLQGFVVHAPSPRSSQ